MLNGPILNITHNVMETGNSMSCLIDLIDNQAKLLQKQLAEPVKDVGKYVVKQRQILQIIKRGIVNDFDKVMKMAADELDGTENKNIDSLFQACFQPISNASSTCFNLCNNPRDFLRQEACQSVCTSSLNELSNVCDSLNRRRYFVELTKRMKFSLEQLESFFRVDVTVMADFGSKNNSSKDINRVQRQLNKDIMSKAINVQLFIKILKYIMSLSMLLMVLQAFLYVKNYISKHNYDNMYITQEFIDFDRRKGEAGEKSIVPLKKMEQSEYIDTRSLKLTKQEFKYCKIGLTQVLLHALFCIAVILFDRFLFYVLNLTHKFGQFEINLKGANRLVVHVNGNGLIARFYKIIFKGIDIDEHFLSEIKFEKCIPNPTSSLDEYFLVFFILYTLTVCFDTLHGYGLRLRRKIAAYYFPEQERARMEYLHMTISHRRFARQRFLRQEIKSAHKESIMKEKFRISAWHLSYFPCVKKYIPPRQRLECSSCEERQGPFNSVKLTECPGMKDGSACTAVYCEECRECLQGNCPLCGQEEVEFRD